MFSVSISHPFNLLGCHPMFILWSTTLSPHGFIPKTTLTIFILDTQFKRSKIGLDSSRAPSSEYKLPTAFLVPAYSHNIRHMKPGGWMELQEIHHYPHNARTGEAVHPYDHPIAQYWTYINEGLATLGVDFPAAAGGKLATKMHAAGFINVTERIFHVPLGTWPKNQVLKTVGLYWRTILNDGVQAIALGPMSRGMGWSREQIEVFLVSVRRAYCDNTALLYMPMHIVYGQKPH